VGVTDSRPVQYILQQGAMPAAILWASHTHWIVVGMARPACALACILRRLCARLPGFNACQIKGV